MEVNGRLYVATHIEEERWASTASLGALKRKKLIMRN
jgi:hypothetical protein